MSNRSVKRSHCQGTKADVLAPPLLIVVSHKAQCLAALTYAKKNDSFPFAFFSENSRNREQRQRIPLMYPNGSIVFGTPQLL